MLKFILTTIGPYIKEHRYKLLGAILLSFVLAGLNGVQVRIIQPIFDKGLKVDSELKDILFLVGILLTIGLINFPCRFFHFYWARYITDKATCSVRTKLFSKILRLPTSFFHKSMHGNLISNIINDTTTFALGFRASLDMVREPLKATACLLMAIWADWKLALVILMLAPIVSFIFIKSGKKVNLNQGNVQKEYGDFTHHITESLSAHKITKAFNLQGFIFKKLSRAQETFFGAQMKTVAVEEATHPLVELIGIIAFSIIIMSAYFRIHSGETTVGEFISFITAFAMFMDPIKKISQANIKLNQASAASRNIDKVLNLPEESDSGQINILKFTDCLEVKNLTFSYGTQKYNAIHDLSFKVKKGQRFAIVGLSGSGKSTLINLLLGLHPISSGSILIDGHPISKIRLDSLRNLFGLVSQDIFLFYGNILDNVVLGKEFDQETLKAALDMSYSSEFINKLSQKEYTLIGDKGVHLSRGQQQRLTIARAILQDADIFLFDEATSALDNESEKMIQKSMDKLSKDKTIIAIAHRLSTIQEFDQILVMHEGKMIEQGTHQELLAQKGEYSHLYQLSLI